MAEIDWMRTLGSSRNRDRNTVRKRKRLSQSRGPGDEGARGDGSERACALV